ncbi:dual oxidase 2-like [Clavelina lepadiformis]|uniref:dual oxidase 2-like n=1 Tax=Clavelina lepadiformis TaxID=159417 RepID=UPI0040413954
MFYTVFVLHFAAIAVQGKEFPPYNGWFNNRGNPDSGTPDSILSRRLSPHYQDGVYFPSGWNRPNPRTISLNLTSGTPGLQSSDGKTALFYFFGQHVMQEIVDSTRPGCPPEFFNIRIPAGDSSFDPGNTGTVAMPYQRSRYQTSNSGYSPNHPRDQLNEVTSFLDGSAIYGHARAWVDKLRLFARNCTNRPDTNIFASQYGTADCRGELRSVNDLGEFPELNIQGLPLNNPVPPTTRNVQDAKRLHQTGGRNINENPFLLAIDVIWFRHHNWLARNIGKLHSDWSEEKVFQEARIQNVATYQKIVFYDWLPYLLGSCPTMSSEMCQNLTAYTEYSNGVSVGISNVFEAAAKHYDVTMAPPGVFRRSKYNNGGCVFRNTSSDPLRVCNTYWNGNEMFQESNIAEVIMGMASQILEKEDHIVTSDLLNFYHGPLEFSRRDLVALIIQQGRDHGLPDYNTAREELGLTRRSTFEEINPTLFASYPSLLSWMETIYGGDLGSLDLFVGGMLETGDDKPGELFRLIIQDQFVRLRNGDRFWFENTRNSLFNETEVAAIHQVTFRDVILRTNPSLNESVDIQDNPFFWNSMNDTRLLCPQPFQIDGPNHTWTTTCTTLETYDYFSGSEASYAIVFAAIALFVLLSLLLMYLLGKRQEKRVLSLKKRVISKHKVSLRNSGIEATFAIEILGENKTQEVQVILGPSKQIVVKNATGNRKLQTFMLDDNIEIYTTTTGTSMFVRTKKATYDMVLSFTDLDSLYEFVAKLKSFVTSHGVDAKEEDLGSYRVLLQEANTKQKRDELLKIFFKAALAQAVKMSKDRSVGWTWSKEAAKLINVGISKEEFAQYLKLKPNSSFVEQMFSVADVDDDGEVSFREFLNIVVLFTKGSAKDKARLMFDMYDLDKSGELSREEFQVMLKSMVEMVDASVEPEQIDELVKQMMTSYGLGSKQSLTLEDFQKMMSQYSSDLSEASLNIPGNTAPRANLSISITGPIANPNQESAEKPKPKYQKTTGTTKIRKARMTLKRLERESSEVPIQRRHTKHVKSVQVVQEEYTESKLKRRWIAFIKWNQNNSQQIFWATLYILLTAGVFLQAFFAVASNQASGLSRIGSWVMALARASAAGLMFNFSTLLLTMSRNTITLLRETFLHLYIPFDSAIPMHKLVAWMALFFTGVHVIAHGINFYSISTQSPADLLCLFRDYWYPSNYLPSFVFWAFQTITGITGIILTLIVIVMYIFASDFARRKIFHWFQLTHKFGFVALYFFSVLHGSGTLISSPRFYLYFLPFGMIYTLDTLYSISRKRIEIAVVKAELLPSDVTHLEFKRPSNFDYKAGQWVRIACLAQSPSEYHPFTLSSAPHEETLKLHIRAVGPWTMNLRSIYNRETLGDSPYPKLFLDGPFGEGHQDWYKYDVSVLVGGGIGVTPFASILKDLVNTTQSGKAVTCKAVYFIWVTRDQKQYEWLTDIIAEVESKDKKMILNTHIFITQFPQKFDLRTTMLYICEQHFQKFAGKSLFTGLRATTHFGRPDFKHFLISLADEHTAVKKFGVFSCGPSPMTNSVDKACSTLNKFQGPSYSHHFENF